jgi:hypothetical protein
MYFLLFSHVNSNSFDFDVNFNFIYQMNDLILLIYQTLCVLYFKKKLIFKNLVTWCVLFFIASMNLYLEIFF